MVKLKFMISIVLINLFLAASISTNEDTPSKENGIITFENYTQQKITLPKEFPFDKKNIRLTDSIIISEEWFLQPKPGVPIEGELLDVLFGMNVINGWSREREDTMSYYSCDYKEHIKQKKPEYDFYYLGELHLSKKFNSFLILTSNEIGDNELDVFYLITKDVYLINTAHNKVISITKVATYFRGDGNIWHMYTEMKNNGIFILHNKTLSSDFVIAPGVEYIKGEVPVIPFTYDEKGFLKRL